ncbi:MAG: ATP-binding protein [Methanimicrococcus sp.]|nr:ATP-binding protein [Methanimicrococcus sp.]
MTSDPPEHKIVPHSCLTRDRNDDVHASRELAPSHDSKQPESVGLYDSSFLHDLLNSAGGLRGYLELLLEVDDSASMKRYAANSILLCDSLIEEIEYHRQYILAEKGRLKPVLAETTTKEILRLTALTLDNHSVSKGRHIEILKDGSAGSCSSAGSVGSAEPAVSGGSGGSGGSVGSVSSVSSVVSSGTEKITTDKVLLSRILVNMTKNAIEATDKGGTVTISSRSIGNMIRFNVHNSSVIPQEVRDRLFNSQFSTKGNNRGIGMFSIRMLGELLGGVVGFDSKEDEGTCFYIDLPSGSL